MDYLIPLPLGFAMIIIGIISLGNVNHLRRIGLVAEGVVFDKAQSDSTSFNFQIPVVRFVTSKNEWVTQAASVGIFPGFLKTGEKVDIVYDGGNPKKFLINSKINALVTYGIMLIGATFVAFSLFKLLNSGF